VWDKIESQQGEEDAMTSYEPWAMYEATDVMAAMDLPEAKSTPPQSHFPFRSYGSSNTATTCSGMRRCGCAIRRGRGKYCERHLLPR